MIVDDMFESYLNLTLKTLRMFKWVRSHCPEAEFIVKIDDDVHLNLHKFYELLKPFTSSLEGRNLIGGHLYEKSQPMRDPNSKWYTPTQLWPQEVLPNFVAGFFYVLGKDALAKIYAASFDLPLFHLEDVFLTGMIGSHMLKMNITGFQGISIVWGPYSNFYSSSCTIQDKYLAIHFYFSSWNYLNCWAVFNAKDFTCSSVPLLFHSYC